jgi:hypothetical protein
MDFSPDFQDIPKVFLQNEPASLANIAASGATQLSPPVAPANSVFSNSLLQSNFYLA